MRTRLPAPSMVAIQDTQNTTSNSPCDALRRVSSGLPNQPPERVCNVEGCHSKVCRAGFSAKSQLRKSRGQRVTGFNRRELTRASAELASLLTDVEIGQQVEEAPRCNEHVRKHKRLTDATRAGHLTTWKKMRGACFTLIIPFEVVLSVQHLLAQPRMLVERVTPSDRSARVYVFGAGVGTETHGADANGPLCDFSRAVWYST